MTMPSGVSPALEMLLREMPHQWSWAQVEVRQIPAGYALRHVRDAKCRVDELHTLDPSALRGLAKQTRCGAYRPLASMPNLPSGWRCEVDSTAALEDALEALYPGSVADWHAWRLSKVEATGFEACANRQVGRYGVVNRLEETTVATLISACCPPDLCLKRRLWTSARIHPDAEAAKSPIPCLEPCAVFLEMALWMERRRSQDRVEPFQAPSTGLHQAVMQAALVSFLERTVEEGPAGNFASPWNPRRVRMALNALSPHREPDLPDKKNNE